MFFLPGSILTLGAGFAYGVGLGTAVVWVGANLGATLAFVFGRTLARGWVAARVEGNPRFAAIDRAVGREGLKIVLHARLSPIFPFNLLNYVFGLTQVSLRDYVLGSLVGMLPGTILYVYLGSLITNLSALTAGRTSAGATQQIFYFAGLGATAAGHLLRQPGRAPRLGGGDRRSSANGEGHRRRRRSLTLDSTNIRPWRAGRLSIPLPSR